LFKERKRLALLSLLSALVVVSTAFVGVSIYAQTDDSELTTFEEEAVEAGANMEDSGLEDDPATTVASDDEDVSEDTSNATATDGGSTSIAEVTALFEGLQVCDLGTAVISNETQIAAVPDGDAAPTVSVEVMTETEVAELASNETGIASAGNETSIASANCMIIGGGDNATSTAGANATDGTDATSSAAGNETFAGGNAMLTGGDNATSTFGGSNETAIASAPESDEEILVIEGQDFVPGQVVLIFTEDALIGIDDVDEDGSIEAKVPMPDGGETAIAGNETGSTQLTFVESGTFRTATFEFDGETLTAEAGGDIEAAEGGEETIALPAGNATSTNSTSTANTTGNLMQ
jgi:archaellum component FlaF (FlaF/FlaG flagellin family)